MKPAALNRRTICGRRNKNPTRMRAEYDFSAGERGRYVARYRRGTNVVVLAPDVAKLFRDEKSVNDALRALAKIIHPRAKSA